MSVSQNYPIIAPALSMDFAAVQALDPRITFARATTATYYGTRTAKAEENLLLQSQTFDSGSWSKSNTTVTADATTAPDGTTTAELVYPTTTGNGRFIFQSLTLASATYTQSIFAKASGLNHLCIYTAGGASGAAWFNLSTGAVGTVAGGFTATITSVGNSWYRCTVTFTASSSFGLIVGGVDADNTITATTSGTNGVFLWGAQLEQRSTVTAYQVTTTQPVTNYIPVLETAASGVARFDHNPVTFESLGLLIEEQRTNLFTYSEQFDNAAWTKTNTTVTAAANIAPDGTQTAQLLIPNNSNLTHKLARAISPSAAWVFSVYVKANGVNFVALNESAQSGSFSQILNLTTGALTGSTIGTTSVIYAGNGWYRLSWSYFVNTAGNFYCIVPLNTAGVNPNSYTWTGNGFDGIFVWGAQIEIASFPTSYIPTVASQVTRAADISTISGTNFSSWFNSQQGTVYCSFDSAGIGAPAMAYWEINNASNSVGYVLFRPSGNSTVQTYLGGSPANIGTITANTLQQAIFTYNNILPVTAAGSLNGATPVAISSPSQLSFIPTRISIGSNRTTTESMTGHIRKLSYYPIAATSAQLQALTG